MKFQGMSIDFMMDSISKLTEDHVEDVKETFERMHYASLEGDAKNFEDACNTLNEILGGHPVRAKKFTPTPHLLG